MYPPLLGDCTTRHVQILHRNVRQWTSVDCEINISSKSHKRIRRVIDSPNKLNFPQLSKVMKHFETKRRYGYCQMN